MCMFCKNTSTIQSTTTHVVNYKDCIIVIKNVPCIECDQCGEKYYTDEVAEKLEIIVNMAKKLMQEIAVIDYNRQLNLLLQFLKRLPGTSRATKNLYPCKASDM